MVSVYLVTLSCHTENVPLNCIHFVLSVYLDTDWQNLRQTRIFMQLQSLLLQQLLKVSEESFEK